MTDWLQYGPVAGVFLAIVVPLGVYLKSWIDKQTAFTQGIAQKALDQQAAHTKAWYEMAQLAVEAQHATGAELKEVAQRIREHEIEMSRQHVRLSTQARDSMERFNRIMDK